MDNISLQVHNIMLFYFIAQYSWWLHLYSLDNWTPTCEKMYLPQQFLLAQIMHPYQPAAKQVEVTKIWLEDGHIQK